MEEKLRAELMGCLPSPEDDSRASRSISIMLKHMQEVFQRQKYVVEPFGWCPDPKLGVFGSRMQGTHLAGSDIDVRLTFEQFTVTDTQKMKEYLGDLYAEFSKLPSDSDLQVTKLISGAKLPLLKLSFEKKLDIDLTLGPDLAADENRHDFGVKDRLEKLPRIHQDAMLLVKHWARRRNLIGIFEGFLSSVAIIVCVFCYFQGSSCATDNLTAILKGFFTWMWSMRNGAWRISCNKGAAQLSSAANSVIFIESPSDQNRNLVAYMPRHNWQIILNEFRRAMMLLESQGDDDIEPQNEDSVEIDASNCVALFSERKPEDSENFDEKGSAETMSDSFRLAGRNWRIPQEESNGCIAAVNSLAKRIKGHLNWSYESCKNDSDSESVDSWICSANVGPWAASSEARASKKAAQKAACLKLLHVIREAANNDHWNGRPPRHKRVALREASESDRGCASSTVGRKSATEVSENGAGGASSIADSKSMAKPSDDNVECASSAAAITFFTKEGEAPVWSLKRPCPAEECQDASSDAAVATSVPPSKQPCLEQK